TTSASPSPSPPSIRSGCSTASRSGRRRRRRAVAADLVLASPLDGWATSLAEVPDPVFAEAMLGDGMAVDPTVGLLRAPCAGVVSSLHAARHALTLRTPAGVEILLHLGLETVALGGEGFVAHVAQGDTVQTGQPLIAFDLDR